MINGFDVARSPSERSRAAAGAFTSTLLNDEPIRYPSKAVVRREGEPATGIFIVFAGWAATFVKGQAGSREVVRLLLPGDVVGVDDLSTGFATETLFAVTNSRLTFVTAQRFSEELRSRPIDACHFLLRLHHESESHLRYSVRQSRYSSISRLAQFLLYISRRLDAIGLVKDDSFSLPLTQLLLSSALGMTAVHLNRTVRILEKEGIIRRDGSRMIILQRAQLTSLSPDPRDGHPTLAWFGADDAA